MPVLSYENVEATFNGVPLLVSNFEFTSTEKRAVESAPMPQASGSFTATFEADASAYRSFVDVVESMRSKTWAAQSDSEWFRVCRGRIERRLTAMPVLTTTSGLRNHPSHLWDVIGTTRDLRPPNNRLRKFALRHGRVVEVRSRGRTGARSLPEALAEVAAQVPMLASNHVVMSTAA